MFPSRGRNEDAAAAVPRGISNLGRVFNGAVHFSFSLLVGAPGAAMNNSLEDASGQGEIGSLPVAVL